MKTKSCFIFFIGYQDLTQNPEPTTTILHKNISIFKNDLYVNDFLGGI